MYSFICHRTFVDIYRRLEATNSMRDIRDLTGCGKPCHYNQYNLVDKLQKYSASYDNWSCAISIWVISPDSTVETEELIYPWTSLVAVHDSSDVTLAFPGGGVWRHPEPLPGILLHDPLGLGESSGGEDQGTQEGSPDQGVEIKNIMKRKSFE